MTQILGSTHTDEPLAKPRLSPAVRAASKASMAAQTNMLRATRLELCLLLVAAGGGALASLWPSSPGAILSVAGFLGAVIASGYLAKTRPEREWYDGRAVAESCKTLAWRYAVGGRPFGLTSGGAQETDEAFVASLREVTTALPFAAPEEGVGAQITDDMRWLRASPLVDRRRAYEFGRIADQQDWYAGKARHNDERARRWKLLVVALELAGLGVGLAIAAGLFSFDVIGVIAAAAAAGSAWLQLKQHESLARAYSVAWYELSAIRSLIVHQQSEDAWESFVDQSEEAVSREHTLWRASRGVTAPTGLPQRGGRGR